MKNETTDQKNKEEKLIDKFEVAKLLNFSPRTIEGWVQQNKIPHIRFSRRGVRFRKSEIEQWLEPKRMTPVHRPTELIRATKR